LSVTDTGCGMAPDMQLRIFEPFFTTKGLGRGTGLGLATVFGIVKQSDAYLWVESEIGRGSTFTICFPVASSVSVEPTIQSAPIVLHAPRDGTETILLVEDEENLRVMTRRILENCGYQVLEAETGRHALDVVAACGQQIDLVISDVIMPELSGPELIEHLQKERPDLPFLYVSGYPDDELFRRGALSANIALLSKPFSHGSLAAAVRDVLHKSAEPRNQVA